MIYNEIILTASELQTLLEHNNPKCYDEIRIVFNNNNELILSDLKANHRYNLHFFNETEGTIYKLNKSSYPFKSNYFYAFNQILMGDNPETYDYGNIFTGETYNDIKLILCLNHAEANITTYDGEKMGDISTVKELKQFFIKNQKSLKYTGNIKTSYGGIAINGIGKKVMIHDTFYTYTDIFNVLKGKDINHMVSYVLRFLM